MFSFKNKEELKAVLQGNANFTKDLYNILSDDSGNVFFSPISAHIVLSMIYQAAQGPTKDALSACLHIPEPVVGAKGYSSLISLLHNTKNVQLYIANKIYINENHKLLPSFKKIVKNKFLSKVDVVNFTNNVQAANAINSWVEGKTNDKIKNLISPDSLNSLTRAVLVNAIYFKGYWLNQFEPSATSTQKFYLNDNHTVDCQMMFRKGKYMFKEDQALNAKVLEIPYKNKKLSLIVILPNKRNGIGDLEAKLTDIDLTKITEGMYVPDEKVCVALPKFKIESRINLKDALSKMGLEIIFDPVKADFTGMVDSSEPTYVSEVIQKAFIEVNEEGTEAVAATGMIRMLCRGTISRQFRADHPFIIVLQARHGETSDILFHGRVSHPTY